MMLGIETWPEYGRAVEALTWDPALDREAEIKRLELERLLEEIDELED
jgi:hypothetical protein